MAAPTDTSHQPATLPGRLRRWVEPVADLSEPERRRSRVLATLTLTLILCAIVFLGLVFVSTEPALRPPYAALISAFIVFFLLAYYLNRLGRYYAAAGLIVGSTVVGPWAAIALNIHTLSEDVFRLAYISASVLLSGLLLSTRVTLLLAAIQFVALFIVSVAGPTQHALNWASLLGFILFVSVISLVSNYLSRRDMAQIEQQTQELQRREVELRDLSVRDTLTGLFNRRYLEETLDRELGRASRKQLTVGVIMADVDHFKRLNDTHGHAAGDSVMRQLGAALRGQIRGSDIACRYGGEEFTLILPEATLSATLARAENVREIIKAIPFVHEGIPLGSITLSLGVAVFPEHGQTGALLLKAADSALYAAKHAGRDRVMVASPAVLNTPT